MLVWGGTGSGYYADGAAFDPVAGTWTALPTAPITARGSAFGAWTGTELLIWGGSDGSGTRFTDGALYNPSTKTWRKLSSGKLSGLPGMFAGLVGGQLVTFGGIDTAIRWQGESAALDTLTWSDLPLTSSTLDPRFFPVTWSFGSRWYVWSGYKDDGSGGVLFTPTGAAYDSSSRTWSAMPTTDAPLPRSFAATHTIAQGAIVWSGLGKPGGGILQNLRDGAVFVP